MTLPRDQIEARMRDIAAFIAQATDTVRSGRMVSLHHLDDEVAALCEAAVSLPPADAAAVQPLMAEMIGKLEELARVLKDYQSSKQAGE